MPVIMTVLRGDMQCEVVEQVEDDLKVHQRKLAVSLEYSRGCNLTRIK